MWVCKSLDVLFLSFTWVVQTKKKCLKIGPSHCLDRLWPVYIGVAKVEIEDGDALPHQTHTALLTPPVDSNTIGVQIDARLVTVGTISSPITKATHHIHSHFHTIDMTLSLDGLQLRVIIGLCLGRSSISLPWLQIFFGGHLLGGMIWGNKLFLLTLVVMLLPNLLEDMLRFCMLNGCVMLHQTWAAEQIKNEVKPATPKIKRKSFWRMCVLLLDNLPFNIEMHHLFLDECRRG